MRKTRKIFIITTFIIALLFSYTSFAINLDAIDNEVDKIRDNKVADKQLEDGTYEPYSDDEEHITYAEKALIYILNSLSNSCYKLFDKLDLSIDKLVFAKRNDDGSTSKLLFNFDTDNPFGSIAMRLYHLFRGIAYMAMFSIISFSGMKITLTTNRSQAKADFKSIISSFVISFFLLFLMPDILKALIWGKDQLLYVLANDLTGLSFIDELHKIASKDNARLLDAIIYFAFVAATLWFAFVYAAISMGMAMLFAFFPLANITMNSNKVKSVLDNWTKEFSSALLVPVIDGSLLLVPIYALQLGVPRLFILFMIMMIMPTRNMMKGIFGVRSSMGSSGMDMMRGASKMVTGAIGGTKETYSNMKQSYNDYKTGSYYDDVAKDSNVSDSHSVQNQGSVKTLDHVDYDDQLSGASLQSDAGISIAEGAIGATGVNSSKVVDSPLQKGMKEKYFDKYANTDWLNDSGMTRNLSAEQKAKLYKKRARNNAVKTTMGAVGGVGGALLGASSSVFFGPAGMVFGASVGGQVGKFAGEVVGRGGTIANDLLNKGGKAEQQKHSDENTSANAMILRKTHEMSAHEPVSAREMKGNTHDDRVEYEADQDYALGTGQSNVDEYSPVNNQNQGYDIEFDKGEIEKIIKEQVPTDIKKDLIIKGANKRNSSINDTRNSFIEREQNKCENQGVNITPEIKMNIEAKADEFVKTDEVSIEADRSGLEELLKGEAAYKLKQLDQNLGINSKTIGYNHITNEFRETIVNALNDFDNGKFKDLSFKDVNIDEHFA